MKSRVLLRPAAEKDIRDAREWYQARRGGLGDEFVLCMAGSFARLEEFPGQFPTYHNGFRRVLTVRFPYKIFFRIEGDVVIVFRILHAARDHHSRLDEFS